MKKYRKPLSRSMLLSCLVFIVLLCYAQAGIGYIGYRHVLYHRYDVYLKDLLRYTAAEIDADDLEGCIRTGEKSEKYKELQIFLDKVKESHEIHYLYVIKPLNAEKKDNVMNVIAAMTENEKKNLPENAVELGELTGEAYSSEVANKYLKRMDHSSKVTFFEDKTVFGDDYTGVIPLLDSKQEPVAVLAADVDIREIKRSLHRYIQISMGITIVLGAIFLSFWGIWLKKRVISPIQKLESGVIDFADKSRGHARLDALVLEIPELHTGDEIESLSRSVMQMSEDITGYAESLLQAENEVERMKKHVSHMGILAYKDALTQVKNKASYDEEKELLEKEVKEGTAEFALLMIDLNYLKKMNDTYGHEHGNSYIQLACRMICVVFAHSPVFRIGGDEFLVLLKNTDYEKREKLLRILKEDFEMTSMAEELEPWERASAAMGLAIYDKEKDHCVDDVFKRADEMMYQNKKDMKDGRE